MEYDSDSELHATDTLRCETDSEEENPSSQSNLVSEEKHTEANDIEEPQQNTAAAPVDAQKASSDEEDQLVGHKLSRKSKKISNIIDSESDEDENTSSNAKAEEISTENKSTVNLDRFKSLIDSDSSEQDEAEQKRKPKKQTKKKFKQPKNTVGALSESDDGDTKAGSKEKIKHKRNKDANDEASSTEVRSARDILASLNLFFDDDDEEETAEESARAQPGNATYSGSEDEYNADSRNGTTRPIRKMTSKQAMEDRQIIQSESQRMARESYINVPYHRTKAYSFDEFLARKTICKPDPKRDCVGNAASTNMSIRMTPKQLEDFARRLEERELESQQFFKSESESSDGEVENSENNKPQESEQRNMELLPHGQDDAKVVESVGAEDHTENEQKDAPAVEPVNEDSPSGNVPPGTATATTLDEKQIDPIDEIVNRTSENMEQIIAAFQEAEPAVEEAESIKINYDLLSADTRSTTLSAKKAALLATLKLPSCPKLTGSSDMLIDLESGMVQPKAPTGPEILFQRLAKCSTSGQKTTSVTKQSVSILSTEDGTVKLNAVSFFANDERPLVHKEPTPGEAYFKLQRVLKEKMDNNRRESFRKREAEFTKKLEIEKAELGGGATDEENDEELLEEEDDEDDAESDEEGASNAAGQRKSLLDDEAMDDEMADADESSSSDEDEDDINVGPDGKEKKVGRIIKAFEDSDDDTELPANKQDSVPTEPISGSETHTDTPLDGLNVSTEINSHNEENEENEENMTLLWRDDEPDRQADAGEDDLMALCSGRFATQLPTQNQQSQDDGLASTSHGSQSQPKPLYAQDAETLRESQLMDLCSGRFETQAVQAEVETGTQKAQSDDKLESLSLLDESDVCVGGRLRLDSSDDEMGRTTNAIQSAQKKNKTRKRKQIHISDDEDETDQEPSDDGKEVDSNDSAEEVDAANGEESGDEAIEAPVRYVEYDSDENEIEVRLTKKEKQRIGAKFLENEAELSESEWGSADEDEKGPDRYDIEVADEEQYDQKQLQEQLEKIHNRQMLDQDDRELEQLKEYFLEDEENDGVGRVRQFRWKNVEKTFSLDYAKQSAEIDGGEANGGEGSDEETELNWRKLRYERAVLLKEKNIDLSTVDLTATTLLNPADPATSAVGQEQLESMHTTLVGMSGKKKITVIKKTNANNSSSATAVKEDNPFLISSSSIRQGHKASFLSRDQETLNRLASLIPESENTTSTVTSAKARNFVFSTLSPAIEKSTKRALDADDGEENATTKKAKTTDKDASRTRKKMLLDALTYESGDWMQKTDWHRVVVFKPGLRDAVMSYLKKGQRTMVTGKITYGEITDQEGKQRGTTSIIADDVIFLQS
uniref:Uncharacterized protein n=1 Tax=Anopheles dirus TaxID=7168 RepID=A0A182NLA4_9DIPT